MGVISGLYILSQAEVSDPNLLSAGITKVLFESGICQKRERKKN